MAEVTSSPQPQKLSRYRSQRKASTEVTVDEIPPTLQSRPQHEQTTSDTFARSKSRYRRRPSGSGTRPATAADQDQIAVPERQLSNGLSPAKDGYESQPIVRPQSQRNSGGTRGYRERHDSPHAQLGASDSWRIRSQEIDWNEEEERRRKLKERFSIIRNDENVDTPTKPTSAAQTPTGELFPPPRPEPVRPAAQPVLQDGPPTSDQIRATKSMSALPKFVDDDDEDAGCFGFFKRKRGEAAPQKEKASIPRANDSREPFTIRPGGGGLVPGTDAPVSAVNAGDRKVLVECGKSKMMFPVTPTTTPVDIIKSASLSMQERIDMKSAVLLEYFGTVGVQRPLRRYEHIRDVMNSWDTDGQNSLILVDPGTGSSEAELSVFGVPREKPGDERWLLSFSQKVGKWDKRLVTLKSDGQITMQKDPNKPKDLLNVCHLSDFDIYTPTREKARRKIKPPKKICFAIKSQQKTTMFESTQDFVHFFCTNDRATADGFYAAVQGWRSWYLVNVMGEGKKPRSPPGSSGEKDFESGYVYAKGGHRLEKSMESQYALGSFKPLIDMNEFKKDIGTGRPHEEAPSRSRGFEKSSNQFDTTISPERRTSTIRRKQHSSGRMNNIPQLGEDEPLVNLGRRTSVKQRRPSLDETKAAPEEFLATSLLGRRYSQRQREYAAREEKQSNPFTNGSNLLSAGYDRRDDDTSPRRSLDGGPKRTHSTRVQNAHKTAGSGDLQRSNSRARDMPKPLVDLTPQYREPPQHAKKGRGFNTESVVPGALIENATSPEDPLGIPPSTDWRNRSTTSSPHRTDSLSRNKSTAKSTRRPATSREAADAFTGEGLLAGSQGQAGWGGGDRGRGVVHDRAKGPMLDLNEQSQFAQGSLLNKVERDGGPAAPVIDRSRDDDARAW